MKKAVRVILGSVLVMSFVSVLSAQNAAVGSWSFTTISPEGETKSTLVISEDGGKFKAMAKGERGERAYDSVEVKGNDITLVLTISYNGSPMTITYTGKIDKDKMEGEADFGGLATGTWSAVAQK
jgi:hypothetical protein